jgi:hypothetical protein
MGAAFLAVPASVRMAATDAPFPINAISLTLTNATPPSHHPGDIRSRLVRLIPDAGDKQGIKALFAHRLPSSEDVDHATIKQEW